MLITGVNLTFTQSSLPSWRRSSWNADIPSSLYLTSWIPHHVCCLMAVSHNTHTKRPHLPWFSYTCSAPHPPSASLMLLGGSIEGTNSSAAYTRPIMPTAEPRTTLNVLSASMIEPMKM